VANFRATDDLRTLMGFNVTAKMTDRDALEAALTKHYETSQDENITELIEEIQSDDFLAEFDGRNQSIDLDELKELSESNPVKKLLNLVLLQAIRDKASDIHFEPFESEYKMRYRIDGVLYEMIPPPKYIAAALSSRIKVMASLDIAERRLPQDGRISVKFSNKEVDLRVSSLPTIFGEKIVLRILDKSGVVLDLQKLGFEEDDLERFRKIIQTPYGMILVTGPTGSGKSTTLYAAVSTINSAEINIMTAEDPVEYNLPGVNQVHVRDDIGMTFQIALRSFLRQDPDVILVGEMRDTETASIAIRAALTGHLVFSTLHTNDAPSTVTRLLDMGIVPFLVSSSLLMVVAQRLCRRICVECREQVELPLSVLLDVGFKAEEAEGIKVYKGLGCGNCANTGYRGRMAIHEILYINPELQDAIVKLRPANELKEIATKHGMRTLRQSGLRKVALGMTTLDEIIRVTFAD
jgi:type IV pilus assembly protein PilB